LAASQQGQQPYNICIGKLMLPGPTAQERPVFAGEVYLSLLRNRMKELYEIYGLNISQEVVIACLPS